MSALKAVMVQRTNFMEASMTMYEIFTVSTSAVALIVSIGSIIYTARSGRRALAVLAATICASGLYGADEKTAVRQVEQHAKALKDVVKRL